MVKTIRKYRLGEEPEIDFWEKPYSDQARARIVMELNETLWCFAHDAPFPKMDRSVVKRSVAPWCVRGPSVSRRRRDASGRNRRGFTILELLVASLLLGMLVTILTMIFNQSSIAWRTGVAGVADLDEVRDNIAEVREEADNAYIWDNTVHRLLGLWDDDGELRERAWDVGTEEGGSGATSAAYLKAKGGTLNDQTKLSNFKVVSVGSGSSSASLKTYTVNVKSAGPDREFDTYDDIWSFPDDFE